MKNTKVSVEQLKPVIRPALTCLIVMTAMGCGAVSIDQPEPDDELSASAEQPDAYFQLRITQVDLPQQSRCPSRATSEVSACKMFLELWLNDAPAWANTSPFGSGYKLSSIMNPTSMIPVYGPNDTKVSGPMIHQLSRRSLIDPDCHAVACLKVVTSKHETDAQTGSRTSKTMDEIATLKFTESELSSGTSFKKGIYHVELKKLTKPVQKYRLNLDFSAAYFHLGNLLKQLSCSDTSTKCDAINNDFVEVVIHQGSGQEYVSTAPSLSSFEYYNEFNTIHSFATILGGTLTADELYDPNFSLYFKTNNTAGTNPRTWMHCGLSIRDRYDRQARKGLTSYDLNCTLDQTTISRFQYDLTKDIPTGHRPALYDQIEHQIDLLKTDLRTMPLRVVPLPSYVQ